MKEVVKFKNVLDTNLFFSLHDDLKKYVRWELNNVTDEYIYSNDTIWGMSDYDYHSLTFYKAATVIKLKILKFIKKDIRLVRIFSNGQTCGQKTGFHNDFDKECYYTFILFSNSSWDTNWGGEFVCENPITNEYDYTEYIPNAGVLIPAHWQHVGRSPNHNTDNIRTTLAFSYIESEYLDDSTFNEKNIMFK